ncbi:MAG: preprotein translocase subunit YajC [Proteobacteria bacterium]|nr:preprotein translocase subunit YajC [Pseudomonadota bacterium]
MFSLVPDLYAMSPQGGGGGGAMSQIILFGSIFLIFFLLVIRPQQKKVKKHQQMIASLKKGDQIITSSGIHGKINKYFDDKDFMLVEIAEKTIVKLQKNQVADIVRSKPVKEIEDNKTESENK